MVLITPLSKEELDLLLLLASQKPDPNEKLKDFSSIEQWIVALNIRDGKYVAQPLDMWDSYKRWAKDPLPRNTFFRQLKKILKSRIGAQYNRKGTYYLVDNRSFDVHLETEEEMNERQNVRAREYRARKVNAQKV